MKSLARNDSIPNPTLLLFLMVSSVVWLVFMREDPDSTALTVVLALVSAIIVPAAIYLLALRQALAVIVLVVVAAMPRLYIEISSLKARPEHIICGMLLLALPYWFRKRRRQIVWMTADFMLLAYVAVNFVSSIFMSIQPGQTTKWCVQQALAVLPYIFLRLLVTDRSSFERVFRVVLMVGLAEAAFGILCFYSNL